MSARRASAWLACAALVCAVPAAGRAQEANTVASTALSEGELRAFRDELGASDPQTRAEALGALSRLGEDSLVALAARIDAMRGAFDGNAVAAVIAGFRQGPLASASVDKLVPNMRKALAARPDRHTLSAVEWLAYLSALEAQHSPEAAELIVGKLLALDKTLTAAEGPAAIERLGAVGIPALLRGRVHPRPWLRALCSAGLNGSGADVPSKAVQQDDAHLLAAILQVYGDVLAFDAMPVTVSYAVDERSEVRGAALRSIQRFGRNAIWQLRERYLNVVGKDAPTDWDYQRVLHELQHEYAAPQRAVYDQALKFARTALDAGDSAGALHALNPALVFDVPDERTAELAALLLAIGEHGLGRGDAATAQQSFARALRIDPDGVDAGRVRARLAFLDAEKRARAGFLDMGGYESAAELDAKFEPAHDALDALSGRAEAREAWLRRAIAAVAGLLFAAGAAFWLRAGKLVSPVDGAITPSD